MYCFAQTCACPPETKQYEDDFFAVSNKRKIDEFVHQRAAPSPREANHGVVGAADLVAKGLPLARGTKNHCANFASLGTDECARSRMLPCRGKLSSVSSWEEIEIWLL